MLFALGGAAALADSVTVDGDIVDAMEHGGEALSFGSVDCGKSTSRSVRLAVRHTGGDSSTQVFEGGNDYPVTLAVKTVTGDGLSAVMGATTQITLVEAWEDTANNTLSSAVAATVNLLSTTEGMGSGTVTFTATGRQNGGPGTITREGALPVSWTTGTCAAPNTAPSKPGAPAATATPTLGGFSLGWAASNDTESDAFTYTLEGQDADDSAYSTVATGLSTNSYQFASGQPAEGTWTYRVKAVETSTSPALSSSYSDASSAVVVDRSNPNAPTATADRDPEYTGWWKDTVTVTFTSAGDPSLADTSSGSGVASVSAPQTTTANGAFTVSGTATDNAGNVSAKGSFAGNVDSLDPVVSLTCPSAPVILGSSATASWTATDVNGSGVNGASSGTVTLNTSAVGSSQTTTAAAGLAADNVGHTSDAASCTYSVVYDWSGFFQPVDNKDAQGKWIYNSVKAGQGVPMKFSLSGDQGLNIFAAQFPKSVTVPCNSNATLDTVETTVTAGNSSLSYDGSIDQYNYVWKTDKSWAGTCRQFEMKLVDGTSHYAFFSFTK